MTKRDEKSASDQLHRMQSHTRPIGAKLSHSPVPMHKSIYSHRLLPHLLRLIRLPALPNQHQALRRSVRTIHAPSDPPSTRDGSSRPTFCLFA